MNPMEKYLHIFENKPCSARLIEIEMQETMCDLGFANLWSDNLEKYKIQDIRFDDPLSYKPVIDGADIVMLKVLISYAHRQITHWYETDLFKYKDFLFML